MIRKLDLRNQSLTGDQIARLLPRAPLDIASAARQVEPILERVRAGGGKAVSEIAFELDGFRSDPIRVQTEELDRALAELRPDLLAAIKLGIDRVRRVSEATMPSDVSVQLAEGSSVSQRFLPVDSVGTYAPGGKAVYPSSVIMSVVPAQVAGVAKIVLASPGQREFGGRPHPTVLATAKLLGVKEVFSMGGPAAIAAFAYGLGDLGLAPVRLITGPGNIFVAAAKRNLRSLVAIDSEAGTTEIMIIADSTAKANFVAADLISQAEHDEAAAAILLSTSSDLLSEVERELQRQVPDHKHAERIGVALAGQQSALVLCSDLEQAIEIANCYATEHLEIQTQNPSEVAAKITNAGALFLGDYSPVSLGDYLAGSNHVLPTGGSAARNAGLGVHTFLRPQQLVEYSRAGLEGVSGPLFSFASAEDLPAHGEAVAERFRGN